jgi:hypothetical protein
VQCLSFLKKYLSVEFSCAVQKLIPYFLHNVMTISRLVLAFRSSLTFLSGVDVPVLYSPVPFQNAALSSPEVGIVNLILDSIDRAKSQSILSSLLPVCLYLPLLLSLFS